MTRARPARVPTEAKIPTNAVSGTQLGFPSESFETKPGPHEHTLAEQFPREFQTGCRHWKTHSGMEGSDRSTGLRLGAYGGLVSARPSSQKLVGPISDSAVRKLKVDQTVIIPPHISENAVTPHLRKRGGITLRDDVSGLTHDSAHAPFCALHHPHQTFERRQKRRKRVGTQQQHGSFKKKIPSPCRHWSLSSRPPSVRQRFRCFADDDQARGTICDATKRHPCRVDRRGCWAKEWRGGHSMDGY